MARGLESARSWIEGKIYDAILEVVSRSMGARKSSIGVERKYERERRATLEPKFKTTKTTNMSLVLLVATSSLSRKYMRTL